jgi:hypothetical protein
MYMNYYITQPVLDGAAGMKYYIVEPCTTSAGFEIKLRDKLDMARAKAVFSTLGEVVAESHVVLLVKIDDYTISAYGSGRLMVKSERKMNQKEIEELADRIVTELEGRG